MINRGLLLFILFTTNCYCQAQSNHEAQINVTNVKRDYIIHLPKNYRQGQPLPLIFIFHGGSGTGKQMQRYMRMDEIADRENFITVYPNGINKQWNDGRDFKKNISANDDVSFTEQLLDTLEAHYSIDTTRVFATGISNGGFFSIFLSLEMNEKLLAIAPVCANIPERIYDSFHPARPVSLMLMNGTGDPLVLYDGGEVGNGMLGNRGRSVSTDKTIERYIETDKTTKEPEVENIPDIDKNDGCTAIKYTYASGAQHSRICLVKVINGGHALPGGVQYLPKMLIGKVCNDFNAAEMIWQFFKECKSRN